MLESQIWMCVYHSCLAWITEFESVLVKAKRKKQTKEKQSCKCIENL